MARHFVFDALVLKQFPIGEQHRGVLFWTREQGIVSAIAHGAAKSQGKLKLLTSPFRHVQLKAYHDPVQNSWKVVDVEERHLFAGFSELLERFYTACLWAELVLKTQASGDEAAIFDLVCRAMVVLDTADVDRIERLNLHVLWRFLSITGLVPDFAECHSCERSLTGSSVAYLPSTGEALCLTCSNRSGLVLSSKAIDYLLATEILDLDEAANAPLEAEDLRDLLAAAQTALESALGAAVKTFRWA